ncbi:MAG: class I adenylate-forming enzyme family protein [Acidimicrobiia bacterium]
MSIHLTMLLDMAAGGYDDRVAIGHKQGGLSYAQLQASAGAAAALAQSKGAGSIAMLAETSEAMPIALFGAAWAGIPFAPLNYRLSYDQLQALVARLDTPLIICDAPVNFEGGEVMLTADFMEAVSQPTEAPEPAWDADDVAVLLFTSGTTAAPKAALLRHHNLTSYVLGTTEFGSFDDDAATLMCVPPYHIAAVSNILTNLYTGRRVVPLPKFTPETWLDTITNEHITHAMVVPTMLARIVEAIREGHPYDASSLASIAYGGARMPITVIEAALEMFPNAGFVNAYGLTETSSTITLLGPDDHRDAFASDDPAVRARLGSAGRPVPGLEMEIRDAEGNVVGANVVGDVFVRGPQVAGEYAGMGSVVDAEGWFATKDRGHVDDEGYLFIEGRSDDTIIRGGENIAPAEIEDVLVRHPAILEAAVIGPADEEWGQRITAVVVLREGQTVDVDELRAWARERLRASKTPDQILIREELPHTETGKLLRRVLLAEIEGRDA